MNNYPLQLINMEDVEAVPVKWLWEPYIPIGKITIIQGDPGEGKTTLALAIAAALTRGEMLPGDTELREPLNVIFQTSEDGLSDTIKPRLEAANADCNRILVIDETENELSMCDSRIEEAIEKTNAKLVILDPIQAYIGATVDMHRANEIRPIMNKLAHVAEANECAIILIGHLNKASGQKSAYRGLGSIDIPAVARSLLLVGKLKNDPKKRIVIHAKSNLAPNGQSLVFSINDNSSISWHGTIDMDADQYLENAGGDKKIDEAKDFLKNLLKDGEISQKQIARYAEEANFGRRTLYKAKSELQIRSYKTADGWNWKMPSGEYK